MDTIEVGAFRPATGRRRLNLYQRLVVTQFTRLIFKLWQRGGKGASPSTLSLHWFGYQLIKCPFDLWTYQELLVEQRPDVVIEAGTFRGGSALFLAMLMDHLGHGRVITIDPHDYDGRPAHPRIEYFRGSSVDTETLTHLRGTIGRDERCMVILDSDHAADHVGRELRVLREFVPVGGYLIVEDGVVNGHPVMRRHGPGPLEAIRAFLAEDPTFEPDLERERFLMTMNPSGYLKRIRAPA
jgi:cephalosporin hydroxylase